MNGQKIIDFALKFAGKKDNPIYREWFYGVKGITTPDCAVFVDYCYHNAGIEIGKHDYNNGWASVPNMLKYYTVNVQLTSTPVAGDIMIMGWDCHTPMHTGLFIKWNEDGTAHTVEANTSNTGAGSEANGGWTMEKNRPKKFILACVHPNILDNIVT